LVTLNLSDVRITDLDQRFPLKELLALDYFQKYRHGYYPCQEDRIEYELQEGHVDGDSSDQWGLQGR